MESVLDGILPIHLLKSLVKIHLEGKIPSLVFPRFRNLLVLRRHNDFCASVTTSLQTHISTWYGDQNLKP